MEIVYLLVLLQIKHLIFDYLWQTKFELEKPKNNKLRPTLELKKKSEDDDDF